MYVTYINKYDGESLLLGELIGIIVLTNSIFL